MSRRGGLRARWLVVAGFWTVLAGRAPAAGGRAVEDGWLVAGRDVALALAAAAGTREAPGRGWWLTVGHTRLYGMPELPASRLSFGIGFRAGAVQWAWQRLGRELLREDAVDGRVRWGRARFVGVVGAFRRLALAGGPPWTHVELAVEGGLVHQFDRGIRTRAVLSLPLIQAPPWFGAGGRRAFGRVTAAMPGGAVTVALDRRGDGTPAAGLDLVLRVGGDVGLTCRMEPSTGQVGPGWVYLTRRWRLRAVHLVHPQLGVTHRFEFAFGRPGAAPW